MHSGDQLSFSILSVYDLDRFTTEEVSSQTQISFFSFALKELENAQLLAASEAFKDKSEIVLFLKNGLNMHFSKVRGTNDFVIENITSAGSGSDATRELVRNIMKPFPLA